MFKILIILMFAQVSEYDSEVISDYKPKKISVTIALNNNFESNLLYKELTRDWTKPNVKFKRESNKFLLKMNEIQKSMIFFDIKFIKENDINSEAYFLQGEFPKIRFRRGKWENFPKETFKMQSYPLLTIKWMYDDYFYLENLKIAEYKYYENVDEIEEEIKNKSKILLKKINKNSDIQYENLKFLRYAIGCSVYDEYKDEWIALKRTGPKIEFYKKNIIEYEKFRGYPVNFIYETPYKVIATKIEKKTTKNGKYEYPFTLSKDIPINELDKNVIKEIEQLNNKIKKFAFKKPIHPWNSSDSKNNELEEKIFEFHKKEFIEEIKKIKVKHFLQKCHLLHPILNNEQDKPGLRQ